jgi:hypothetical protein
MGRGLSPLQVEILKIAHLNRCIDEAKRRSCDDRPDFYSYEILTAFFGFKLLPTTIIGEDRESNRRNFSRREIGKERYASALCFCKSAILTFGSERPGCTC